MLKVVSSAELGEMFDRGTQYSLLSSIQTRQGLFHVVNISRQKERITIERTDNKLIYTIETIYSPLRQFTYKANSYSYKKDKNNG